MLGVPDDVGFDAGGPGRDDGVAVVELGGGGDVPDEVANDGGWSLGWFGSEVNNDRS